MKKLVCSTENVSHPNVSNNSILVIWAITISLSPADNFRRIIKNTDYFSPPAIRTPEIFPFERLYDKLNHLVGEFEENYKKYSFLKSDKLRKEFGNYTFKLSINTPKNLLSPFLITVHNLVNGSLAHSYSCFICNL